MSGALFLGALALVPAFGYCVAGRLAEPELGLAGRIAVWTAAGAVALTALMVAESWAAIPWSVQWLGAPFLLLGLLSRPWAKREGVRFPLPPRRERFAPLALAALGVLLAAYVAGSARATSSDLLLFWGTKGEHFGRAAGLDMVFFSLPFRSGMHADYPPLYTSLLAWGTLAAGRLPWGAVLLILPIGLLLAAAAFRGFARTALPAGRAGEMTAALVALLGFTLCDSLSAGNAEPPILFFEVLALSALTYGRGSPWSAWVASTALAAACCTKVEGAAFAALAALCYGGFALRRRRSPRLFLTLAVPSALALLAWVVFAARRGLVNAYSGHPYGYFSARHFGAVLQAVVSNASYHSGYLPWIAVGALTAVAIRGRDWAPPATLGFGYLAFILFCYLHGTSDPRLWIGWSASRLLLTPLICFFFSAAAPRAREGAEPGG